MNETVKCQIWIFTTTLSKLCKKVSTHDLLQYAYSTFPGGGSEAVEELGEGEGFGG